MLSRPSFEQRSAIDWQRNAGDVAADVLGGPNATDGAGQNYRAAAATGQDVPSRNPGGDPDSGEVDVDHVSPGLFIHSAEFGAVTCQPGIGDDDVKSTELRDAVVDDGLHQSHVTYVGLDCVDSAAKGFDLLDRFSEVVRCRHRELDAVELLADIDGDDVSTLLRQPDSM